MTQSFDNDPFNSHALRSHQPGREGWICGCVQEMRQHLTKTPNMERCSWPVEMFWHRSSLRPSRQGSSDVSGGAHAGLLIVAGAGLSFDPGICRRNELRPTGVAYFPARSTMLALWPAWTVCTRHERLHPLALRGI